MANFDLMRRLAVNTGGKILLLVMDGLGGLPREQGGPTELEAAHTPNLDRLAREGSTGLSIPVARGIAPGSGPAHLALFGYDPLVYDIGRGVLESVGIGLDVNPGDVAIRGNFCTVDKNGIITDRRAGRISTEEGAKRIDVLRDIKIPGIDIDIEIAKEYRFAMVWRGEGLNGHIADTDPQQTGLAPLPAKALSPEAERTAEIANQWLAEARERLRGHEPANMATLRGFAMDPALPKYSDVYKLKAACVAVYPMYKGVSKLVGMDVIPTTAHDTTEDEFKKVAEIWNDYDFVFCHIKYTDSRGEDGNFDAKVKVIEGVDQALPILFDMNPDVVIVTGDHSTPATYKAHSWHPVPTLLWAPATHMTDRAECFGERECMTGALGQFPATDLMPLALAHAKRLTKYGA
ncbi:MAG TPA: 2,3-bisphosphoglycerate-independent phosphoglycerate mutase [Aggregatilinea sp.]|uniref:2,3-bisphosphoglycerate-independent phosphoglycerate mutase n=1 Tax=Aggregatilinea sp. TaxID=2806333 RepID=UPI002C481969|nr:2,3-bisphosphoglycerate-independent phosphoglycerate mutase [Aggregatilinea sp.]HML24744.1 2,3-bisphosphoglycerate-independent phosphoglycerate mutase [Aggregatilinea sp.]